MDFGTRSIRSAGAGSGSIEVTLPAALRELQGLPCRIILRDGLQPEIVLQPDLRPARAAFTRLSLRLQNALDLPAGDPPFGDILLSLQPEEVPPGAPRLAWTDGVALAAPPPHPLAPLARSLRGLAEPLALLAGIGPDLAPAFAAATAWLLTGLVPEPNEQEGCNIVAEALSTEGMNARPPLLPEDAYDPAAWKAAQPLLRRLFGLHRDWTADPMRRAALGTAW
ncbi:hypothetical protein GCM10011504_29550 [Siccirubricoccus deserti]|uniref:Uncharacterized protein n=1 Tax=Siccirubricoccus deserti TaxID=2013562 RepID=A0A9X0R0X0_9PROT|nr:hypothetical protein [Siccirubricoccus deserti]MBC4016413.1 hypothetical protein [Siccirubricoccus deserti]GGC49209.1 hypothetical protein GCM10011504_29550 [Siccirubricoccus deserti]